MPDQIKPRPKTDEVTVTSYFAPLTHVQMLLADQPCQPGRPQQSAFDARPLTVENHLWAASMALRTAMSELQSAAEKGWKP